MLSFSRCCIERIRGTLYQRAATTGTASRGGDVLRRISPGLFPGRTRLRFFARVGLVFLFGCLLFLFLLFLLLLRRRIDALEILLHVAQRDRALERAREGAHEGIAQHAGDGREHVGLWMFEGAGERDARRDLVGLGVLEYVGGEVEEAFP